MFSTMGLLMNIVRFFFYNFVTQDNKDTEIKQLRAEVENLQNVLEEVVKYLNRNRNNYDEEKAEEIWSDDEKEKEKAQPPTEEKKDN
jgi:ABC-type tungstate transport system permease subunit